ncbi:O-acetyltransferase [Mycobacterium malmoense]|uniref:acyltransferase n=1 Tax=Mycobacterium malmoense TaxID=1780 RepID=UPI00080B4C25|nr:acyltransferase [Mycobacterium malmoense]OCB23474.1 O-acetyltransferase [Mycobacterium malmoense]OCB31943.1 O-acetyltransferase [Mycobacterium malmoense]
MAYLDREQLARFGFKRLGRHVKVSDRAAVHNADQIEIGDYSRIDDFCVLSGRIVMGRNVHLAVLVNIAGGSEGVFLDDFSGIAYGSHVFSQTDDYSGRYLTGPTLPLKYRKEAKLPVRVGRHSIVGAGSMILPGVELGEGTSIGAGSVVTKSTPAWSICVGSPARKIKDRRRDLLLLEAQYLAEEDAAPRG